MATLHNHIHSCCDNHSCGNNHSCQYFYHDCFFLIHNLLLNYLIYKRNMISYSFQVRYLFRNFTFSLQFLRPRRRVRDDHRGGAEETPRVLNFVGKINHVYFSTISLKKLTLFFCFRMGFWLVTFWGIIFFGEGYAKYRRKTIKNAKNNNKNKHIFLKI